MKRTRLKDILLNPVLLGVYTVILIVGLASIDEVPGWFAILILIAHAWFNSIACTFYWGNDE